MHVFKATTPGGEAERLAGVADRYTAEAGFEGLMVRDSARRLAGAATGTALEVGCGEGYVTRELARVCSHVVAIEAAERYAQVVRALELPGVEVVESLAEEFESDERFDTIVLSRILEHVDDPVALLASCAARLAHGGHVLIAVPNAGSLHRRLGTTMHLLAGPRSLTATDVAIGHRRVYDETLLRAHVDAAGLRLLELSGHFVKPLSNAQMDGLAPEVQAGFLELGATVHRSLASELFAICSL